MIRTTKEAIVAYEIRTGFAGIGASAPGSFGCFIRNCRAGLGAGFDCAIDDHEGVGDSDGNPK